MRRPSMVVVLALASALGILAWQGRRAKDLTMPWAFPVYPVNIAKDRPPVVDDGKPKSIPGSDKAFTRTQINDYFSTPDWFPNEHPPWPKIVQYGRKPVIACAFC